MHPDRRCTPSTARPPRRSQRREHPARIGPSRRRRARAGMRSRTTRPPFARLPGRRAPPACRARRRRAATRASQAATSLQGRPVLVGRRTSMLRNAERDRRSDAYSAARGRARARAGRRHRRRRRTRGGGGRRARLAPRARRRSPVRRGSARSCGHASGRWSSRAGSESIRDTPSAPERRPARRRRACRRRARPASRSSATRLRGGSTPPGAVARRSTERRRRARRAEAHRPSRAASLPGRRSPAGCVRGARPPAPPRLRTPLRKPAACEPRRRCPRPSRRAAPRSGRRPRVATAP